MSPHEWNIDWSKYITGSHLTFNYSIMDDPIGSEAFMSDQDRAVQEKAEALAKEEFAAKLADFPEVLVCDEGGGVVRREVSCPKCSVGFARVVYHGERCSSPEHLAWACVSCGYSWCSKTAS